MFITTEPCQYCGSRQVEAPWTLCPGLPPRLRENAPPAPPRHDAPANRCPVTPTSSENPERAATARRRGARAHQPPRAGHARPDRGRLAGHVERNRRGKPSDMADPAQGRSTTTARPMPRQPFGTLADMAHPHLRAHRTAHRPQATHAPDNRRLPRMRTRGHGRERRITAAMQMRQPNQRGRAARAEPRQGRGNPPDVFRQVGVSCLVMYFFRV